MRLDAIVVLAVIALGTACRDATRAGQPPESVPDAVTPVHESRTPGNGAPGSSFGDVTVPAGTRLQLVLQTPLASDTSRVEQPVSATLAEPVTLDGTTVFPAGSRVTGRVVDAGRSGKVRGRARLAVRFDGIVSPDGGERYDIETSPVARTAASQRDKDALTIVAPAAGGAIVGRIVGGRKGAAIGTAAGGAAGAAVVLSTRGKEVRLATGTPVTVRLAEPLVVRLPEPPRPAAR